MRGHGFDIDYNHPIVYNFMYLSLTTHPINAAAKPFARFFGQTPGEPPAAADTRSLTMEEVEYRLVVGFPNYRVGDDGSIWSRWVKIKRQWTVGRDWTRLKCTLQNGYLRVGLRTLDHKKVRRFVHDIVLEAFVGPCPDGMQGCHFPDRSPLNNRRDNVRWGTPRSNQADRLVHGTDQRGEKNHQAKLTSENVREIRALLTTLTCSAIARKYNVSRMLISQIKRGVAWTHIL